SSTPRGEISKKRSNTKRRDGIAFAIFRGMALEEGTMETIKDFISRRVVVLPPHDSVQNAARAMRDQNVGSVVVARGGEIQGVITDRDLACSLLASPEVSPSSRISQCRSEGVVSVEEFASVDEAIEQMARNGVRRVVVVRETEKGRIQCIGVVSLDDLLLAKKVSLDQLTEIVRSQVVWAARNRAIGRRDRKSVV